MAREAVDRYVARVVKEAQGSLPPHIIKRNDAERTFTYRTELGGAGGFIDTDVVLDQRARPRGERSTTYIGHENDPDPSIAYVKRGKSTRRAELYFGNGSLLISDLGGIMGIEEGAEVTYQLGRARQIKGRSFDVPFFASSSAGIWRVSVQEPQNIVAELSEENRQQVTLQPSQLPGEAVLSENTLSLIFRRGRVSDIIDVKIPAEWNRWEGVLRDVNGDWFNELNGQFPVGHNLVKNR